MQVGWLKRCGEPRTPARHHSGAKVGREPVLKCLSRIEKSQILTDRNVTKSIARRGGELDDNNSLI